MRGPWDPIAEMQAANRALKRAMLRDLDQMSRRELLRRGGRVAAGASAAAILFRAGIPLHASAQATPGPLPEYDSVPDDLKGSGEVRVQSYGGAFQDAQREAYFKPFEQLCGIKVIESEGPDISKIKAMVDTGNVEQDVVELDRADVILLEKQGDYWEPIDYSIFDTANIDEGRRYKYSIDMLPYSTVIGYRNDVFAEGPQGQANGHRPGSPEGHALLCELEGHRRDQRAGTERQHRTDDPVAPGPHDRQHGPERERRGGDQSPEQGGHR